LANGNYDITFAPGTLTVTARPITFKADDVTRVYGESTPAFEYSVSAGSIIAGDTFGAASFSAAGSTVGSHAITLSGLVNANYDITFASGTLTVTARPVTFKADDIARTYGESTPAFGYSVTAGNIIAGDAFGAPSFSAAGSTVGSHAITLSGLANANYDITFAPGTLTVAARPITFKADDITRTYGESTPAFGYSVSIGSITAGDTFGAPSFSAAGSTVGSHVITLSGLANANYDVTFAPGTLTVTARPITFKADNVTRTYGESTPAFAYSLTAGSIIAGDTFGAPSFSAAGSTVGTHAITLSGLANANYDVTLAPGTLTVTARPVTVTADPKTKVDGQVDPPLTYQVTSGSLVNSDSFGGTLTRVAGDTVGTYAIQQGSLSLGTNYSLTYVGANFTITPACGQTATFLAPIKSGTRNVVKLGNVIPVKLSLTDCNGHAVTSRTLQIRLYAGTLTAVSETTQFVTATSVSAADTTGLMRLADGQYMYNLGTKGLTNDLPYTVVITAPATEQTTALLATALIEPKK
jgi:putative ubiquitin-RnfH superfamily antitoxin RatB of RatAB toxin-antitoxin module